VQPTLLPLLMLLLLLLLLLHQDFALFCRHGPAKWSTCHSCRTHRGSSCKRHR
jgi:hypothetical protein